jgi:predicted RND superfamily exporter protein
MAWMFSSYKMVLISLIPNIIPLLITGAIMGFFGIALKPSTILVFSIAFGISVDDTIHFLAKYRQELISNNGAIRNSVFASLKETGVSMLYTSVVLFFGFFIFIASDFGGTVALGLLVSITLLIAMLSNLLLLPALLLTYEKKLTGAFVDPKHKKIK